MMDGKDSVAPLCRTTGFQDRVAKKIKGGPLP